MVDQESEKRAKIFKALSISNDEKNTELICSFYSSSLTSDKSKKNMFRFGSYQGRG